jgi:hypothetical protein
VHRGVGDEGAAHLFIVVKNEAAEEEVEAAQPLEVAAEEEHAARDQLVHLLQLQDGEAIPRYMYIARPDKNGGDRN